MRPHVEETLQQLEVMETPALQQRWSNRFKTPPPKNASQDFLHRALAHEAQAAMLGGLKARTKRRLIQMAKALAADPDYIPGPAPKYKSGTKLIREWQGKRYEVMVLERGFAFEGRTYDSLSKIATDITGTRWSGPLFFGLRGSRANIKVSHAG